MPTTPLKSFLLVNIKSHFHLLNPYIKRELKTRRRRQRWVFFFFFSLFDRWLRHFEIKLTSEKGGRMKNHIQQPLYSTLNLNIFTFYIYVALLDIWEWEFWAVSKSTSWKMVTGKIQHSSIGILHNGERNEERKFKNER